MGTRVAAALLPLRLSAHDGVAQCFKIQSFDPCHACKRGSLSHMFVRDCRQHRYREFLGAVANVIAKVDHRVVRERDRFFAREVRAVGARYFDSPKRSGVDKEPIDDALIDFALVAIPISVGRIEDHEEFASAYFALSTHELAQQ